jgi:major membrane immunogen (membrane-anchored lipoprotein)
MINTLTVLLSGLLLCGCSQKQATSASSAIDLVEAGKDITSFSNLVIHVTKRDGTSIEGIQIIQTGVTNFLKMTITADTGTLSSGSSKDATDKNFVKISLNNATIETITATGKQTATLPELTLETHR